MNEHKSADTVVNLPEWAQGMEWRRGDYMPPRNQRVLAYCEGASHHSGVSWFRNGYAFMVRWDAPPPETVGPGWARPFYDDACRQIGADYLNVIAWMPMEKPTWATR